MSAGSDLQTAINSNPAGTTFCLASGVHRVSEPLAPRRGQRFVGAQGAVVNGARVVTNWTQNGSVWSSAGQTQGPTLVPWSGSSLKFEAAKYADDVYFDGLLLRRVLSLSEVTAGTFFFDYDADAIYLGDNPSGHIVELATADGIFKGGIEDVEIRGLTIEKSRGRGVTAGQGWVIEGNEIRLHATVGIRLADRSTARSNYLHHNGQYGINGSGNYLVVERNEIAFNNTHRFYVADGGNWASGGTKFSRTGDATLGPESGLILRGNHSHDNFGDGLWLDIDNIHPVIEDNTSSRNERRGINYEISYRATVRNNVVSANGEAGIRISSSPDVEIYGNRVENNGDGIILWQQGDRGAGAFGYYTLSNAYVHDNTVTMPTGKSGVGSYGDMPSGFSVYSAQNRFEGNRYFLGGGSKHLYWSGGLRTSEEWIAAGNDRTGSFTTI